MGHLDSAPWGSRLNNIHYSQEKRVVGDLGLTGLQGVLWWLCPVLIWNGVIDRYFCWDIMKQGKKVLALGSMACIMDFRVFHGNLCRSYQEEEVR